MRYNCEDCGRFHGVEGCASNLHPKKLPNRVVNAPHHGHTLRENQPRVKDQISRELRRK